VIELGAGTAVPTVRMESEKFARKFNAPLIRINPEYPQLPACLTGVSMTSSAVDALIAIDQQLQLLTDTHYGSNMQ
jgi:hypothetical protein